ncbi:MAG: TIGR02147 family protein [Pseudobdellovibrionaceae bacterium]
MNPDHFRSILQQEYLKRTSKNPRYSLRSYANSLGVHHSTLSGLLSGKRPITKKTVLSLSLRLGFFPDNFTKKDKFSLPKHEVLDEDCFNRISEWYFDAILELSKMKTFDFTAKNISQYLGINEVQAASAIDTLVRLKLLKRTKSGFEIVHVNSTNLLSNDATSAAMRRYQKSILEKSIEALESVDRIDRDHTSTTLAIKKSDLPKAKKIIKDFRHKLSALLQENNKEFDKVYQLQISLFPLEKKR